MYVYISVVYLQFIALVAIEESRTLTYKDKFLFIQNIQTGYFRYIRTFFLPKRKCQGHKRIILIKICILFSGQDQFYGRNEDSCVQKGGMCILNSECEKLVEGHNLCPEQKSKGFECCQGRKYLN